MKTAERWNFVGDRRAGDAAVVRWRAAAGGAHPYIGLIAIDALTAERRVDRATRSATAQSAAAGPMGIGAGMTDISAVSTEIFESRSSILRNRKISSCGTQRSSTNRDEVE